MKNLNKLTPFKYFALTNFPYIEEDFDALTNYELFCKIVEYINSISSSQNDVIEDFNELKTIVDALANELHNLDFQEEVNNKLDEMAEDGTLENLILPYIASILMPSRTLQLLRYGRFLDLFYEESRNSTLNGQAIAYYDGYYFACGSTADRSAQGVSVWGEDGILSRYKNDYTELYHANGIAVDSSNVFVACQDTDNSIGIINKSDLSIDRIVTFPELNNLFSITNDNNDIYFASFETNEGSLKLALHKFDKIEDSYETIGYFKKPINIVPQNICVHNGKLYILYNESNMIYQYDIERKSIDYAFYIPQGDGLYPTGECESIIVKDNDILLYSAYYYVNSQFSNNYVSFTQLFKTDILSILEKNIAIDFAYSMVEQNFNASANYTYSFNPATQVTTLIELSALANYHNNALLQISNISYGKLFLNNGTYSIQGGVGTKTPSALECKDCVVNMYAVDKIENISIIDSTFNCGGLVVGENFISNRATIEVNNLDLSDANLFRVNNTNMVIKNLIGSINSALHTDIATPLRTSLDIKTKCMEYIMKLFACFNGTSGGSDYPLSMIFIKPSNSGFTDMLTKDNIISSAGGGTVGHPLSNVTQYTTVRYKNNTIYTVNSSAVEEELTGNTMIIGNLFR